MIDARISKLARSLVQYSCDVQKGENVLIEAFDTEFSLVNALIKEVYAVGGNPFVGLINTRVRRELLKGLTLSQVKIWAERDADFMKQMNAYIGVRGAENAFENSDVPNEQMSLYNKYYWEPVHNRLRVRKTKWVVLRYPTPSMAQMANTSTEAFEDFYFDVCSLDYQKMSTAMNAMCALMDRTDKVRITAKNTDLTFSIKGIPSIKCDGKLNIPDGEIYTAPIKNSVEGIITYNTSSIHDGFCFDDVQLVFEKGKIVKATCNDTPRIEHILKTDEGARYIGEFAIGVNPFITQPLNDTLFDEKIAGSIHFTPGASYDDADNGNKSAVHWDMVLIQTPEYGGGEIYFDGVLIRKNGMFVLPELLCLNPENLK